MGSLNRGDVIKVKKANPELLLHEQKRKVEIDLIKLADELKEAGMGEKEIEENVQRERQQMMSAVEEGTLRYDSELDKKTSHELALEKDKEMQRFEKALSINRDGHKTGEAFDQELQEKLKLERIQQRAEPEQQKLVAAKKAEKARQKAEKLRKKADKAKKKAEKKLEKLKAKQEKKKIKAEKKAAKKKEEGVEDGEVKKEKEKK